MWTPEGDALGRRSTVNSLLLPLSQGDSIYPMSDIQPTSLMKVVGMLWVLFLLLLLVMTMACGLLLSVNFGRERVDLSACCCFG
jgi:hypothetical protein